MPSSSTSIRSERWAATIRIPSMTSVKTPGDFAASLTSDSVRTFGVSSGATSTADTSVAAAMAAKTQPGPTVASSAPARAGATSIATLSFHPDTTFAAVSSSGRRARNGTSAVWAGRVVVIAVAESAARK